MSGSPVQNSINSVASVKSVHSRSVSHESDVSKASGLEGRSTYTVSSKITGVLKDLEDDIVKTPGVLHMGTDNHFDNSYLSGTESVYVEHKGKFTKAPKKMLSDHRITDDSQDISELKSTPLDMAIWMQKTWSKIAKLCLGFLGGLALLELIYVVQLMPLNSESKGRFFIIYPFIDSALSCLMLVFLTLSLIVLFDWIDLGHFQVIHVGDSLSFKKIVLIIILLFSAFVLLLCNRPMDDSFFLHESSASNFSYDFVKDDVQNMKHIFINWEFLCIWKDCLIILAWVLLILSNNEDLFLLHLLIMKKYDYRPTISPFNQNH